MTILRTKQPSRSPFHRLVHTGAILLLLAAQACNMPGWGSIQLPGSGTTPPAAGEASPAPATAAPEAPLLEAEVVFHVTTPGNTPEAQTVSLVVLEEVTGLALNAQVFPMDDEGKNTYSLKLALPYGTVVKYRYERSSETAPVGEHLSDGRPVSYRLYRVDGPGETEDVVSRWTDTEMTGPTGRIMGRITDALNGQPLPNLLVAAGGAQALTTSDGSYYLEGLPPGTHNLVAYALDGAYRTYQQGARIAAGSTTPADLILQPAPLVELHMLVHVPEGTVPAVPLRLSGNLYQLGNTFATLSGGVSTLASRLPVLRLEPDGSYILDVLMPAGADIRYLYTLGDGFWNAERDKDGNYNLRQLIVPENETTIEDSILGWGAGANGAITFDITVPASTPPGDYVSIQLKPLFGWTEPIPMWNLGGNRWAFMLLSPLDNIGTLGYRFCRNDQCGAADDIRTVGPNAAGFTVEPKPETQIITDEVPAWTWLGELPGQTAFPRPEVAPREPGYMAGIELASYFHPSYLSLTDSTLASIQDLGANWVVLSPTWSWVRQVPPVLEAVTGKDPSWMDISMEIQAAKERGLDIALYPSPVFPMRLNDWWVSAPRDFPWWQNWFERYSAFILSFADLAQRTDASALILGGGWVSAALPNGTLPDGNPSGVPEDTISRWRALLKEVRSRYSGKVLWAVSSPQAASAPEFLDEVDQIYVRWFTPLSQEPSTPVESLYAEASRIMDENLLPLQQRFNKPLVLSLSFPSAVGSTTPCLLDAQGSACLTYPELAPPNADLPHVSIDFQEQVNAYAAVFQAASERPWISGLVANGYYPGGILQDKSASIRGKPAQDVLLYWFPRLRGVEGQ